MRERNANLLQADMAETDYLDHHALPTRVIVALVASAAASVGLVVGWLLRGAL